LERAQRPGGRIHSLRGQGPRGDLVVEAGGYRFAPKPVSQSAGWNVSTPLTAKIIQELGLPTVAYNPNPSDWDHGLHKIVTPDGQDAGYLTFIERMLGLASARNATIRYGSPVVSLRDVSNSAGDIEAVALRLQSGEEVVARSVLLNIPQHPMVELLRASSGRLASLFPKPLYNPVFYPIMKLYLHYDDAWWRNDLGLVHGPFANEEPPAKHSEHVPNIPVDSPAPLLGQYHDGDVRCDLPEGKCRGFLQTYYGGDSAGRMDFFLPYVDAELDEPAIQLNRSAAHHSALMDALHASLVDHHRAALLAAGGEAAVQRVQALQPSGGIVTIWNQGVAGIHAGCHVAKRSATGSDPVPGELSKAALKPLPGWPVYVANEAFGPMTCWAESSLVMSEAALRKMGVPTPAWLEESFADGLLEPEFNRGRASSDPWLSQSARFASAWPPFRAAPAPTPEGLVV